MQTGDKAPTPASQPKRWPIALFVAFVTGLAGALLAIPVSDWAMEAHHVSSMEGGRACAAVGIFAPLGFFVGFLIGFTLSLCISGVGFVGYLKRQMLSLAAISSLVLVVGWLGYATADHPPLVDGKMLALEIEVRAPTKNRSIADLKAADFHVALVVSASDRSYSDLRWGEATRTEEYITVPAWAVLRSKNAGREITVHTGEESGQIFNVLLRASPSVSDVWSEWMQPRERFDHSKVSPQDAYQARYRVRLAPEPTPWPEEPDPAPDASPEPTESTD